MDGRGHQGTTAQTAIREGQERAADGHAGTMVLAKAQATLQRRENDDEGT